MKQVSVCCRCMMPVSVPEGPVVKSVCINPACSEFLIAGVNTYQVRCEVGAKIRQERLEKKWTLRQLADKIGKSCSWLSKIERGEEALSFASAVDIALALSMDVERLLWLTGETAPWMARVLRDMVTPDAV